MLGSKLFIYVSVHFLRLWQRETLSACKFSREQNKPLIGGGMDFWTELVHSDNLTWMFPSPGERLSIIWGYIRLACYPSLDMLNVTGELVLLLLGTAITATLQFHSPRCDQLSSSQLRFVVEWWGISPYLNNPTSSTSEHPNKSPPPTEGLLYVYIVINSVVLLVSSSFLRDYLKANYTKTRLPYV